jgi:pimeloyl-ACP methyl ester carboxylesterase
VKPLQPHSCLPRVSFLRRGLRRLAFVVVLELAAAGAPGAADRSGNPATPRHVDVPAVADRAAAAAGPLLFSPCQIEHPQRLSIVAAQCGTLTVLENPDDPAGRKIDLFVARVPAINRRKRPDPLFVIAGGPGMAATTFYAMVSPVFARIHRDRDIILVDQRGTGKSHALNCAGGELAELQPAAGAIAAEARQCLQQLGAQADVAQYTTSVAVRDLDRVRQVLGYDRINLYGVSYGTRVVQHYLRRFESHTRSVMLDGIVPPQLFLGAGMALDAERSLERILARCAGQPECRARLGDPERDYHALRAMLKSRSVPVSIADPVTDKATQFDFKTYHLASVLRLSIYSAEPTALLPLLLHEANVSQDLTKLAAQFLLLSRSYTDAVAVGMNNTVTCTEDIAFYDPARVDRLELDNTFLGTAQLDGLLTICKDWPRGPIDSDFHAPLHSAVPALLLSGSDDPVTPPPYGELARRGLSNSLHVVLQGFGHGQLAAPCMDRVMNDFVARGSVAGLDVACTRDDKPMPFFVSFNGPAP